jgi:diaminopimelate epimerase
MQSGTSPSIGNIEFAKLHAHGNDYLILQVGEEIGVQQSLSAIARKICSRRTGVGADGIVCCHTTLGDDQADYSALIVNADGSRAEISGNGLRCLAAYLHHEGIFTSPEMRVRTVAGPRILKLLEYEGGSYKIEGSMGSPVTDSSLLDVELPSGPTAPVGRPLQVGEEEIPVTLSSMGNPHCSTFWPDVDRAPVERLGPQLEMHDCFPRRTNVEFIEVIDRNRLKVRFWERGVGITHASGTGASAAVVAAVLQNSVESPVEVETIGGTLTVRWNPPEELFLTGKAEYICSGVYRHDSI